MPTITLDTDTIEWGDPSVVVDVVPLVDPTAVGVWSVWVVERDGTPVIELTDANPGKISERRNEWPTFSFTLPKSSLEQNEACQRVSREVQVRRNGVVMFVGPILTKSASGGDGERTYGCVGVWWYFSRRLRRGSPDELTDFFGGRLDGGHLGDGAGGLGPVRAATRTVFLTETYTITVDAYVKLDTGCSDGRLLTIEATGDNDYYAYAHGLVGPLTLRDAWVHVRAVLDVDASEMEVGAAIKVQLYPLGGGDIEVGTVRAIVPPGARWEGMWPLPDDPDTPEGLTFIDQATLVKRTLHEANEGLHIGVRGPVGDTEGVVDDKSATLFVSEVVGNVTSRDGGVDVTIEATRRTRTAVIHWPRQGRDIDEDELVLSLVDDAGLGNVLDYDWDEDDTTAANSVTVEGADGYWVEYRAPVDHYGVRLDDLIKAPSGLPNNDLSGYGKQTMVSEQGHALALKLTGLAGYLIEQVKIGDRVPLTIDDDEIQYDRAPVEIMDRDIDPLTDSMDANVNLVPA